MMCDFKCPKCGWSLEGEDEMGVCMYDDEDNIPDDFCFNFCFHCGYEIPEPDSIEKILSDATVDPRRYYAEHIGHDVGLKNDAQVIEAFALSLLNRTRNVMR